ncbi:MAG: MFS transporter [Planctomycetota bacterium]|nr:MFS transporter [Planctomycetota bacterium]
MIGSVLPFLPVFLDDRGLSRTQIGYVTGAASVGVVLTPVLITLLADAAVAGRMLMAGVFTASGVLLAAVLGVHGFWPILACYALHALAFAPAAPLQDGIYFAAAARDEKRAASPLTKAPTKGTQLLSAVPPYHVVRVWGTVGYIVPSAVLYFVLTGDGSVAPALACGVAMCAAGALNAMFFLPRVDEQLEGKIKANGSRLPTVAAVRALLEPHVLVFCVAMALVHFAASGYYQFYPLYLTEARGIEKRWVGLIANLGVVVEIFFMLGFGWLSAKLTLRGLMITGVACIAVRLLLLAFVPTNTVAIGTQLLHGMMVLVLHVAPPIYLNSRAGDEYRSSIQGLYAMAVAGGARIVGSVVTGRVAEHSLTWMFAGCAGLCVIAAGLFYFAFREERSESREEASGPVTAAA